MYLWAPRHSLHHIAVISRHYPAWAWARLQLLHPVRLLVISASRAKAAVMEGNVVGVVVEHPREQGISVVTLSRCRKRRRQQS